MEHSWTMSTVGADSSLQGLVDRLRDANKVRGSGGKEGRDWVELQVNGR